MQRNPSRFVRKDQLRLRRLNLEKLERRCLLAGDLHLLKDINAHGISSSPQRIFAVGNTAYFSATTVESGTELWKSDGTPEGTMLVKDIWPGPSGSQFGNQSGAFASVGNIMYFPASDGRTGSELWKTDGTPEGTLLVRDTNIGPGSSNPFELVAVGNTVFYFSEDGQNGRELFRSDGTQPGTGMVKDIFPGSAGSNPSGLVYASGLLYFFADDGIHGKELWKSDGSPEGTMLVKDVRPNGASFVSDAPIGVNGTIYFSANDGVHGPELWKSDGTPGGTVIVSDIGFGAFGSTPTNLTDVNGTLFFRANEGGGPDVWMSDGTADGTVMVRGIENTTASFPSYLTNVNGVLYYSAKNGAANQELWKTDGTEAGTVLVKDIYPGQAASAPQNFRVVNGVLYFTANDGAHGSELWKSDGTESGTQLVMDLAPGSSSSSPSSLQTVNGVLFFSADDTGVNARELWRSDGTASGTYLIRNVEPSTDSSIPSNLVGLNGKLYFGATDGSRPKLWTSDGTESGTVVYNDVKPGRFVTYGNGTISAVGGWLFYNADDGIHGTGLWSGTSRIGIRIYDDHPSINGSGPVAIGGSVYFAAPFYGAFYTNLWATFGSTQATAIVTTNGPQYFGYAGVSNLVNLNGNLVFSGTSTDGTGFELLHIDYFHPTLKDIRPGPDSSNPRNLTVVGSKLFFSANDGVHGNELWMSDGTEAGTVLVKDIAPGALYSSPAYLTVANGVVYFTLTNDQGLRGLWRSDGTEAGTYLVTPDESVTSIANLTNVGGRLYFTATDPDHGNELWTSDGTATGTKLFKDIRPGSAGSQVMSLANVLGALYFSADDGVHGAELWSSDGTAEGTQLVQDLTGDSSGSNPQQITEAGGRVYLVATTRQTGQEVFVGSVTPRARMLFYNNSMWDEANISAGIADDAAIATGKSALLPGTAATFSNYSSYSRGINGVMVDLDGTPGTITTADFEFQVGNENSVQNWTTAPAPLSVSARPAPGSPGISRVTITWPDGVIVGKWLQVTVKATAATGLLKNDVFYFGNAPGETGNSAANAQVNATDEVNTRKHPYSFRNPPFITNAYDFNQDGLVNATDQIIARSHPTTLATALVLIRPTTTPLSSQQIGLGEPLPFDVAVATAMQSPSLPLAVSDEETAQDALARAMALIQSQDVRIGDNAWLLRDSHKIQVSARVCDAVLLAWDVRLAGGRFIPVSGPVNLPRRKSLTPDVPFPTERLVHCDTALEADYGNGRAALVNTKPTTITTAR